MQKILYLELNITSVTQEIPRQLIESKRHLFHKTCPWTPFSSLYDDMPIAPCKASSPQNAI